MFSKTVVVTAATAFLGLAVPVMVDVANDAAAQSLTPAFELSMDAGVEAWSGDITYQIGYPVEWMGYTFYGHFPFSELKFPLDDVAFGSVEAEALFAHRYVIGLELKKSITDPDNNMEDRDWITEDNPRRLDIYSESKVLDFEATTIDVDMGYRVLDTDRADLTVGFGYLTQNFEYDTAVIRQWSPSGLRGYDYVGDGRSSLLYEVDFEMIYLMLEGRFNIIPQLNINARFAYSPWTDVEDTDQHLLRNKVNTGDLSGTAVMFSAEAEYNITPQLFVAAGFDYTYAEADGDMAATFYGVYDHTVTEEIETNQGSMFAKVGFRFGDPGNM